MKKLANLTQSAILLNAVYAGGLEPAMTFLSDFEALGPIRTNMSLVPWNVMPYIAGYSSWKPLCEKREARSMWSAGLREVNVTNMVNIFHQYETLWRDFPDALGSTFELGVYAPQGVQAISDEETAVSYRDISIHRSVSHSNYLAYTLHLPLVVLLFRPSLRAINHDFSLPSLQYTNRNLDPTIALFGAHIRDQTAKYSGMSADPLEHSSVREGSLRIYPNYAHGDEPVESMYGARKLAKLRELKKTWDPENLFGFMNAF